MEVFVPTHRVDMTIPTRDVQNADVSFTIYSDDALLGELLISRGTLDWRPTGRQNAYSFSWEELAALLEGSERIDPTGVRYASTLDLRTDWPGPHKAGDSLWHNFGSLQYRLVVEKIGRRYRILLWDLGPDPSGSGPDWEHEVVAEFLVAERLLLAEAQEVADRAISHVLRHDHPPHWARRTW